MNDDLIYKIAITKIPNVGPVSAKSLISYCGGIKEVFEAPKKALLNIPGIGAMTASNILNQKVFEEAEEEVKFIEEFGIRPLFFLDKDYPQRLKHYNDCPIMLYYKGNANLNTAHVVSIIGTRKPTPQGIAICEELVEDLKQYNVLIVSGLAYGIDVTAHKKSLNVGIETVGVLGNGLSMIYPPQHNKIAEQMIENGGILTEFTSKTNPDRENFPTRNRIVAGMCDALIVVESGKKGGSIITAQLANGYNKDVFAFPGRIKDKNSQGCNNLIKTNKAALIESAKDIGYIMRWEKSKTSAVQRELFVELTEKEQMIVDIIRQQDEIGIDKLTYETGIVNSEMASLLLNLEFAGMIKTLPGKRYVLI